MPSAAQKGKSGSGSTNLPVNIAAEIAREIEENSKRVSASTGDMIRITQDKKFRFPDGTEHEGPISVVVLDFAYGNSFYDRPYKEGENIPPVCFARGLSLKDLVPSEHSPEIQSESCAKCPNNEFGSKGDGKACSNNAFLALTEPGVSADPKILVLKVSPTAIRLWDAYVNSLKNTLKLTPIGVVTEVYLDPSSNFASLRFGNPTPNPDITSHFALRAQARERLLEEPDVSTYTPPAPKKPAAKRR